MALLSIFIGLLCGWALGCCLVYAGLRWAIVHMPGAVICSGSLALLGWLSVYANEFSTTSYGSVPVIPLMVPLTIHALFLVGFGAGVLLLEANTHHTLFWWHKVLFCALYFGAAQMLLTALLAAALPASAPLQPLVKWSELLDHPPLSMPLVWLFPLGAPLMELLLRHMQRTQRELAP